MGLNCVFGKRTTSHLPFKAHRHFSVFKDLLTYILKVKFALRSAIRVFDTSLKIYRFCKKPFTPASSVKWSCSRFLALPRREPLQGTGLQEGVTQSICRATDTISAYINHISTARPPDACWGDSFMAQLENATCQSAGSDRYQRAGTPHCHTDSSGCGDYFQNENCIAYLLKPAIRPLDYYCTRSEW